MFNTANLNFDSSFIDVCKAEERSSQPELVLGMNTSSKFCLPQFGCIYNF